MCRAEIIQLFPIASYQILFNYFPFVSRQILSTFPDFARPDSAFIQVYARTVQAVLLLLNLLYATFFLLSIIAALTVFVFRRRRRWGAEHVVQDAAGSGYGAEAGFLTFGFSGFRAALHQVGGLIFRAGRALFCATEQHMGGHIFSCQVTMLFSSQVASPFVVPCDQPFFHAT